MAEDDPRSLEELAVERRREDRRRQQVPVPVDRRTMDRRARRLEQPRGRPATSAVVVDEWPLVRAGVVQVLSDLGVRTAVESSSAADALRDPAGHGAELAVLGLHHDTSRVDAARVLKGRADAPRLVVLLDRTDAAELKALLAADVDALLLRTVSQPDLRAAVERVRAGHRVVAGPAMSLLATAGLDVDPAAVAASRDPRSDRGGGASPLTAKEQEVLQWLARGESTRDIAEGLHVSAATVKTHLHKIYAKLGVASRQAALVAAVERGLLR